MSVAIRLRTAADIPNLVAILIRVYALDGYPVEGVSDPEAWLRHPNEIQSWVAVEDGEIIGQITLTRANDNDDAARAWRDYCGGDIGHLAIPARLFIDPAHRGIGAGRLLMQAVSDYAKEEELAIAFDVMLKDRAATHLYESLGARQIATLAHQYGDGLMEPASVYTLDAGW